MLHFLITLFLCFFSTFSTASSPTSNIVKNIEEKAKFLMKQKSVPGLAIGIIMGGEIVYAQGIGVRDMRTNASVTPETVFQLGSVSKAISGTLIGVLVQNKKLHLHGKIQDYLPKRSFGHEGMTLQHVTSHTTGIPRYGFNALIESESKSRDELHHRLTQTPLKCTPGACYDYHNVAFSLIDPIIEENVGMSFEKAAQNYLFTPLNMRHTTAHHAGISTCQNRAAPHQKTAKGPIACSKYRTGYYDVAPAGGINSNLNDMLQFLLAQLGHSPDVLSKETLKTIHTPLTPAKGPLYAHRFNNSSYGVGWKILDYQGHKIVFHGGWVKGFMNIIAFIPEKDVGIVILQNAETCAHWILTMSFFDEVLGNSPREWGNGVTSTKATSKNISAKKFTPLRKKIIPKVKQKNAVNVVKTVKGKNSTQKKSSPLKKRAPKKV
jgi:beta-lactamase class C